LSLPEKSIPASSRIAQALEEALFNLGKNVYFLDINRLALAAPDSKDTTCKYDTLIQWVNWPI